MHPRLRQPRRLPSALERVQQQGQVSFALNVELLVALLVFGVARSAAAQPRDEAPAYETTVYAPVTTAGSTVVLGRAELVERGARTLTEALALLGELVVRPGPSGKTRVDVRTTRQRSILLRIDGVPIRDAFDGEYDLAAIPVTDLEKIVVVLTPARPTDGLGGDGGTIDVVTRQAGGAPSVRTLTQASTLPDASVAATGRTRLGARAGVRASLGASFGQPLFVRDGGENNRAVQAGLRFDWRRPGLLLRADAALHDRSYQAPSPGGGATVEEVTRDREARVSLGAEWQARTARGWAGGFLQTGELLSRFHAVDSATITSRQQLRIVRGGFAASLRVRLPAQTTFEARVMLEADRVDRTIGLERPVPLVASRQNAQVASSLASRWRWLAGEANVGALLPLPSGKGALEAWLSATAHATAHLRFVLVAASRSRVPTVRELYSLGEGNPDLRPERTRSLELRAEANVAGITASVAGWLRTTDGLIGLRGQTRLTNLDRVASRGFDLGLRTDRGPWLLRFYYVFADAGPSSFALEPIVLLPRHRVDLQAGYQWRRGGVLARVQHVGARPDSERSLWRYTTFGISGWVRVAPSWQLTARIENALAADYELRSDWRARGVVAYFGCEGSFGD